MILDASNLFSAAQAVTASAISDVIDTFIANGFNPNTLKDLGAGEGLWLDIVCTETVTAAGAATVAFSLESDDNVGLTSATVHFTTPAIPKASLTAGTVVARVHIPSGFNYERYLGVRYTVTTGPLTAGKFTAFLAKDVQNEAIYAKNYVIS